MHISDYFKNKELFDSHAHLNSKAYEEDRDSIIQQTDIQILDVATDIESAESSIELSRGYKNIKSFVGIDPEVFIPNSGSNPSFFLPFIKGEMSEGQKGPKWIEQQYEILKKLITNNRELIIGIGETGMDYYWLSKFSPLGRGQGGGLTIEEVGKSKLLQQELFAIHIKLSEEFNLPMTIHTRGAERECFELVNKSNAKGIFHSYTGDYETAKLILDSGNGLGVNGIITFKNAATLREVYRKLIGHINNDVGPEFFYKKGIFFETDSPFLSPDGKRGERNSPVNVKLVYDYFVNFLSNASRT